MIILKRNQLVAYAQTHANAAKQISAWIQIVEKASWKRGTDVVRDFATAKIIQPNRARFEIRGNKFRLLVEIDYGDGLVEIRFIGTHAEYNRIDAATY